MIRKIAYKLRHLPGLSKANWIWDRLRKPYHKLINLRNRGVPLILGNNVVVRIPPDYYSEKLKEYEPENVALLAEWVQQHPKCIVLDIGCSTGYMSAVCLSASDQCEVIAFDSDVASLKATQHMCQYAGGNRLKLLYGFISDKAKPEMNIREAHAMTNKLLDQTRETGRPGTTRYVNLDKDPEGKIPTHSLDTLFKDSDELLPRILVKCDIEGAEMQMLKGGINFLKKYSPNLLLSVHPDILPVFNSQVKDVENFLNISNYNIEVVSIDHEEHWWCKPKER